MTADPGFIRAICEDPHEISLRLIYADWLEEHGEAERAEFIRCQVKLTMPGWNESCNCEVTAGIAACRGAMAKALIRRERELWHLQPVPELFWSLEASFGGYGGISWEWRRGFIEVVGCTFVDWQLHGSEIVAKQPVVELYFTQRTASLEGVNQTKYIAWAKAKAVLGTMKVGVVSGPVLWRD